MKIIFTLFCALLITACDSHRVKDAQGFKADSEKGLVLLSFTKSGLIQAPFRFHYQSKNGSTNGSFKVSVNLDWKADKLTAKTKKDDYIGEVILLELPVGEYEIYELTIDDDYFGGEWDGGTTVSYSFTVTSSKIEYIGNYHVYSYMGLQHALGETLHFNFGLSDRRDRDIAMFVSKYPELKSKEILFSSFENKSSVAYVSDNPGDLFKLGYRYSKGDGVDKDLNKACALYEQAAQLNFSPAQNNVGLCYEKGEGKVENFKAAIYWYEKAVQQNNKYALKNLGDMYLYAKGIERNYLEAKKLYEQSAEQGHIPAYNQLAYLYRSGKGIEKDYQNNRGQTTVLNNFMGLKQGDCYAKESKDKFAEYGASYYSAG